MGVPKFDDLAAVLADQVLAHEFSSARFLRTSVTTCQEDEAWIGVPTAGQW